MAADRGREVVIVEAVRTPIGRGHPEKGYYKDIHPADLLGRTYKALLERSGVDLADLPAAEDEVAGRRQLGRDRPAQCFGGREVQIALQFEDGDSRGGFTQRLRGAG